MANVFKVEIITPERTFYQGEVESLILPTIGGQMGILRGNAPLVSVLVSGEIKLQKGGKWYYAASSDGFVEVTPQKVVIFCETVFWPGEMEMEELKEKERHQREMLDAARDEKALYLAKLSLLRTEAKISVKKEHPLDAMLEN